MLNSQCQNCGCPDELEYFEYVLGGITLCDACSWEPPNKIKKLVDPPTWKKIGKNWVPPDSTPCISAKQSEMIHRVK